jgi:hypothetical protein
LSTAPNGKDHPDASYQASRIKTIRAANSPSQKTLAGHRRTASRPHAGLPLRSHNSLLHNCPSAQRPRLPNKGMPARACLGSSRRVRDTGTRARRRLRSPIPVS